MEIKQHTIAFQLKDGATMLLHEEDYNSMISKLSIDVALKMMKQYPDRVYFEKDTNTEKVDALYKIMKEQDKTMTPEMKNDYLKVILELTKSDAKSLESYKEKIESEKEK